MHRWHFNTFHQWFNMTNDFPTFASFSFRSYLPSCLPSRNLVFHISWCSFFQDQNALLPPPTGPTLQTLFPETFQLSTFVYTVVLYVTVLCRVVLCVCVVSLWFSQLWKVAMTCFPTRRIWNVWVFSSAWNIPIHWELPPWELPKLRWGWLGWLMAFGGWDCSTTLSSQGRKIWCIFANLHFYPKKNPGNVGNQW